MKTRNYLMLLVLVGISIVAKAQVYQIEVPTKFIEYDLVTGKKGDSMILNSNYRFEVVKSIKGGKVIKFKPWEDKKKGKELNETFYKNEVSDKYLFFFVYDDDFSANCFLAHSRYNASTLTLPIKIRPWGKTTTSKRESDFFDFDAEINLGLCLFRSFKSSLNNKDLSGWHTFVGLQISQVKADSATTDGYLSTSSSIAALSGVAGIMYKQPSFDIIVSLGVDYTSGRLGKKWVYQGVPWFGIGITTSTTTFAPNSKSQKAPKSSEKSESNSEKKKKEKKKDK